MQGAIRKREILAHPIVTVQCFGWSVFFRAMVARRGATFLSVLTECAERKARRVEVPEFLARCVGFEERAQRLYADVAGRFAEAPHVADLFETLARQESHHAELLQVCAELATSRGSSVWRAGSAERCRHIVDQAERRLGEEEAKARQIVTVTDALRAAIRIETSEVNDAFAVAIGATDSVFVRTLEAFCTAEDHHLRYLHERIVTLAPELADEARQLIRASSPPRPLEN